ncbi:small glutamine-rich tetratricopeptide repeat-containing protein alpha [Aplysia californica]|uniref:Small glutamine-rich tetratricopeptide repeat-containing protein alpha n=1 Tax=Aplysia californica TaxID=6500 RepID=A0ABM1VUG1_APLCA|nr:small glutamine-rich tetratricopeptide repeat-containing protein alpha [Aplysia californica]XP_035826054.1 small glutamine-rich tetratricopeptide repeat-containing protein alpha [Aplysia californica]
MADVHKLVFSILKFLGDQKTSGQLDDEAVESLEVAIQCLEQVYKVNTCSEENVQKYSVQQNLLDIFNAQLSETESDMASLSLHEASPDQKEEAERLKNKGNEFMKSEKYSDALESYSQAIRLDPRNAVYFCNRAAAYSKLNKHQQAIEDCNRALAIDPSYSKAYGRMGIAFTALDDHESGYECYRKALELDPDNQSYQNNLEIAEQKLKELATQVGFNAGPTGTGALGGAMGNMDFGTLFNDPNILNMATTLMGNPQVQQMMANLVSGGGPSADQGPGGISSLLQASQQMASQMQQANPQLVQHLREQMRAQNPGENNSNSGPSDSNPGDSSGHPGQPPQ